MGESDSMASLMRPERKQKNYLDLHHVVVQLMVLSNPDQYPFFIPKQGDSIEFYLLTSLDHLFGREACDNINL